MSGYSILASAAVKSAVILAAAAAVAWMLRRRSAAARHLVWTAAAAALLALPILNWMLPALSVPTPQTGTLVVFQVFSGAGTAKATAPAVAGGRTTAASNPAREIDLRPVLIALSLGGAALGIVQMLFAFASLRRLRRSARPFDPAGLVESPEAELLESDACGIPMTFGVLRPTVLLPAGAADWNPERLRCVLLHELAHVRRGDVATHLIARTALVLYWWNPLAWYAWRQFLKERERATDDLVLHAGARASDYAGHLLEVARTLQPAPATAWAAIAMARPSELEGRLIAILDSRVNRTPSRRRSAALAVLFAVALVAPFAAVRAQNPALPPELDPTVRAANAQKNHQLLDNAAAAYQKIAQYDVAHKLLQDSLTIREQVSGTGSASYAAGLVKLGELAAVRHQTADATAFYTKAVSLGDRAEVAPALLYLGAQAFDSGDSRAAEGLFQRVLIVQPHGESAGRALNWLAVLRQGDRGGESDAELYFQRAAAEFEPGSSAAFNALMNYSRLLRRQNRTDEADRLEARAHATAQAAAGNAAVSPGVYRVGGGVTSPKLIAKKEPQYTEAARKAKLAGTVLLYVEVEPDGMVGPNIRVMRSLDPGLDEQAVAAVKEWRFRPGQKDGMPVPVAATIEVNFRLL
jgi:TonB family protein